MSYLHILLICFASCSFAFFLSSRIQHSRNSLHVLKGTQTTPVDQDARTTAEYEKDLYGVLGVSSNSTKEQLRDAYWAIASRNHPDRNSVSFIFYFVRTLGTDMYFNYFAFDYRALHRKLECFSLSKPNISQLYFCVGGRALKLFGYSEMLLEHTKY